MRPVAISVLAAFLLACCTPGKEGARGTSRTKRKGDVARPHISEVVFHENDSVSRVYLKIENQDLLYKRPDTSSVFYCHLRISGQLLLDGNSRKVTDSAVVDLFDRAGEESVTNRSLYASFPLGARYGSDYVLQVEVFDMNRRARFVTETPVAKRSRFSAQNFLLTRNDSVLFRDRSLPGREIGVRYNDTAVRMLYAESFPRDFGPALPPFSSRAPDQVNFRPDTAFTVSREGGVFSVVTPDSGFLHLRVNQEDPAGMSLFGFGSGFPNVASAAEMIACARYIMSREEYERCQSAPDPKKAIDDFWVNIGGSNERARELLKRYYGRVLEANRLYSSYTQGWKTDRGMIYVVFGRPVNVYKGKKDEIWVYGNEANPATLRFVFNKLENPYSENDYVMERSQFYKEPWYRAVDFWRQGHVYFERGR